MQTTVYAALIFFVWLKACFKEHHSTIQPEKTLRNPAYLIKAENGAVAAENERCSVMGVNIMKAGGNAVDAAISAVLCVGVVNMFSSGIGGGGFMTVRIPPLNANASSEVYTIDFRETAPAQATAEMFKGDPGKARLGGLSVAVPSELRGLAEAHRRWGKLAWEDVVRPNAELAKGWTVDRELAKRIKLPKFSSLILNNPDWKSIFAPSGKILKEGEIIRRANFSQTLEIIATEGPEAFYRGPLADSIIKKVRSEGGILSHEDLHSYTIKVERALVGSYLGRKVYTTHAPTSGPVLLHMLNLMEHYDLVDEGRTPLNTHRLVEALKFGFAARTKICDPLFHDNKARIDQIPTKAYADLISANLTDHSTHTPDYYNPEYAVKIDHGTSHTSAIDKNGLTVSITSTINVVFGSQVLDPETGVLLNDEMDDFAIPGVPNAFGIYPSPYNYPAPGKRPLSSIAAVIIEHPDGSPYLAIGGAGGSRIFGSIFQTILNLDWDSESDGLDVSRAIEAARLHDQLYPYHVDADSIYPQTLLDGLRERGHNVTILDIDRTAAAVQAVAQKGGQIYAASDSRKNGVAAGY